MTLFPSVLLLVGFSTAGNAQDSASSALTVVPEVDLSRYMGTWYEIARLPNSFQTKCVSDVTANYTLLDDGTVQVVNRCRKDNGEMNEAKAIARKADKDGPNSKLEVRFAPAWLSFLPFVWGEYWIIDLAPDYSYAAVGGSDRKYLWILSRTPSMDATTYQQILERIKRKGYDLTGLIRTKQS